MKEKYIYELCPHCGSEVKLLNKFERQICPECDSEILPCGICKSSNCNECKLEKESWLDTFWEEKGIENRLIEVITIDFCHLMSTVAVKNMIKRTTKEEQETIKKQLIKLDFYNADIYDYLKHLAKCYVSNNF